jgi:hypothetical protein
MMEKVESAKKICDEKPASQTEHNSNHSDQSVITMCSLEYCSDKDNCLSLDDILRSFNAPLSEEQAWSLIYQSVLFYRNYIRLQFIDQKDNECDNDDDNEHKPQRQHPQSQSHRIKVPKSPKNLNVHKDGSIHINDKSRYFYP